MTEIIEVENTRELKPTYRQIDNFTKNELDLIESEASNCEIPYDIVYNFYKFLKTLTKEQRELYLKDSEQLWKELKVNDIENPYIYSDEKINQNNNEVICFENEEQEKEYWKKRLEENKTHEDILNEMDLKVLKSIKE